MADDAVSRRVTHVLDEFAELKDDRSGRDEEWRLIGQLQCPTRNFNITRGAGELRGRSVRDPIGIIAGKRLAAFIYGYQLNPGEPWVTPKTLARDATTEETIWFEDCAKRMHAQLSGPISPIAAQFFEGLKDNVYFGNTFTFNIKRPGMVPTIQTLPFRQCYAREDGEGKTDTIARSFCYSARIAARRYPKDPAIQKALERDRKQILEFVHLIEPREGGQAGAIGARKPYTSTVACVTTKSLCEDDKGFDRMPIQMSRFERLSESVYGRGPGWDAYPAAFTCNAIAESVLRAGELATDPILFGDPNVFGGRFDRRPGAFNPVNNNRLFGQDMRQVMGKIDLGGDASIGVQLLDRWRSSVEQAYFMDWLTLREGANITATEVNDRRDIRLRMLAPINARMEQEYFNPIVEDFFFAMLGARMFLPPPRSLASEEIGFTYSSPLALAQRGQYVDAIERTFATAKLAMEFDENAGLVLRTDEMLRDAARLRGVSEKRLRSFEELEQMRQQRAEQQQQAHEAELAKAAGSAVQSGAQGVATLKQAFEPQALAA